MLEATVAASVAVRENLGTTHAADRARILPAPYEADLRAADANRERGLPAGSNTSSACVRTIPDRATTRAISADADM